MQNFKRALKILFQKSNSNSNELDFLQVHLDRTSRSFAFCIRELNTNFRQVVSLSYLLCRILDTIEDYNYETYQKKVQQFEKFESFILSQPSESEVQNWISLFPSGIPESYQLLIQDSYRLFSILHQNIDPEIVQICQTCILKMKQGMQFYSNKWEANSLRLGNLAEVNRYCYFVAGIVGELLRKIYCQLNSVQDNDAQFKVNSIHFGFYLQKINFLKDWKTDEAEGRFFIPDRTLLIKSLKENAVGAFNFLQEIPVMEKGFRLFCAWSFYIGLASLKLIESNKDSLTPIKLPRIQTIQLIEKIKSIIDNNDALEKLFHFYFGDQNLFAIEQATNFQTPSWFVEAVAGILSPYDIEKLKL